MSGNDHMLQAPGQVHQKPDLRAQKPSREEFRNLPRHPVRLVLDGVVRNYNIGAIFRLSDAMLVESLTICGAEVNLRKRMLVQAARGTQYWVPWQQAENAETVIAAAKADRYQIVVVEQTSGSIPLNRFVPKFPVCLVMGAERSGVSQHIVDLADVALEISMFGMANSINVASAAAIALHHLTQQLVSVSR